jgi:hypothetical protein
LIFVAYPPFYAPKSSSDDLCKLVVRNELVIFVQFAKITVSGRFGQNPWSFDRAGSWIARQFQNGALEARAKTQSFDILARYLRIRNKIPSRSNENFTGTVNTDAENRTSRNGTASASANVKASGDFSERQNVGGDFPNTRVAVSFGIFISRFKRRNRQRIELLRHGVPRQFLNSGPDGYNATSRCTISIASVGK